MPNNNVTINQLESLGINDSIDSSDKLIIYDVSEEEGGEEPTKSVTFEKFISSLAIPTYDLASTSRNGLIKQIRTDVADQALVYATKSNATTAGWFAVGNSDLQADIAHGGTIRKLSGNSYDFLNGNGNWYNIHDFYNNEYIYFTDNTTAAIKWNLGTATGQMQKMVRLVRYSAGANTGLGLLDIVKPSAANSAMTVHLRDIVGTPFASKFNLTTVYSNAGNYLFGLQKNVSETAYLTLVGFGTPNLLTTTYSNSTTGTVSYGTNI